MTESGRETLPEPARFVFAGCATGAHDCPVRYDGYGGTLLCSCACHTDGLHEWRQAAYQATRERDDARRKLARIDEMATAWRERFSDTISTAAVVEALRIVIQEQS